MAAKRRAQSRRAKTKRNAKAPKAKAAKPSVATRTVAKREHRNSLKSQETQQRCFEVVARKRNGSPKSLTTLAAEAGTTLRTVKRRMPFAVKLGEDGRYAVTKFDRIPRTLNFITKLGIIALTVRDSRTAALIGRHMAAVHIYLNTGNTRVLQPFRRKWIRVDKVTYPFITDAKTLDRLAHLGEVSFEDLYALTTGESK